MNTTSTEPTERTYGVAGMTCDHCVAAVRAEIGALAPVTGVTVDLVPGGTSRVTVTATAAVPADQMRAAVDEPGYALVADPR